MKALSIRNPWITYIIFGGKTEEYRTWKTNYRGKLLLCASSYKLPRGLAHYFPTGVALATVNLESIEQREDEDGEQYYAWLLNDVQLIEPFPVKGKLHLFDIDDSLIHPYKSQDIDDYFAHLEEIGLVKPMPDDIADAIEAGEYDDIL